MSFATSTHKKSDDVTITKQVIVCDGCGYIMGVYGDEVLQSAELKEDMAVIVWKGERYHAHLPPALKYWDTPLAELEKDFSKRFDCFEHAVSKLRMKERTDSAVG